MKKACWIYQDRFTDDLVLVRKPHRRAVNGRYYVEAPVFKRQGFRPDKFLGASGRRMDAAEFRHRYKYFAGLNTKGTVTESNKTYYEKAKAGDKLISYSFMADLRIAIRKAAFKHHYNRMMEQVHRESLKLGVQVKLHCIEIDTSRTSKFVPKGYKKYMYCFVARPPQDDAAYNQYKRRL